MSPDLAPTSRRITFGATSSKIVTLRAGKIWRPSNVSTKAVRAGGATLSGGGSRYRTSRPIGLLVKTPSFTPAVSHPACCAADTKSFANC